MSRIAFAVFLALVSAVAVGAKDLRVAADGSGDFKTLLPALKAAEPGDVVTIKKAAGQVGVALKKAGKHYVADAIVPGSPAEAAGLKPGQRIIAVDGEPIDDLSVLEAVKRVRGPFGAVVVLKTAAADGTSPREVSITRGAYRWPIKDDGGKLDLAMGEQDREAAAAYAPALAEGGRASARAYMGFALYNGWGMAKNEKEALRWAELGAESGDMSAQRLAGSLYYNGTVVKKDYARSLELYQQAANQGDATSMYMVAVIKEFGLTGLKDPSAALKWARRAASPAAYYQTPDNTTRAGETVRRLTALVGSRETAADREEYVPPPLKGGQ